MLFDAHEHLNYDGYTEAEREAVIQGVIDDPELAYVIDAGSNLADSMLAADHAAKYDWCYATAGCHPHDTGTMDELQLSMLRSIAKKEKVAAVGEIGLDFHYDFSPRDDQRKWFREQIRMANDLKMPIVIHCREADQECMDILKEEQAFSEERKSWFPKRQTAKGFEKADGDARVLIHCFSGSAEMARQYVKLGATISICGPVTYKNNRKAVETAEQIPAEFLTVETDSPYLAPEPKRGHRNKPNYVAYTARRVAVIKKMSYEDLCDITLRNAKVFYGID
jgi:Mg-dependent DNase